MKAKRLPEQQPLKIEQSTHARERECWKAKLIPRPPKDGEVILRLTRPQLAPATAGGMDRGFATYARGDLFPANNLRKTEWVVVASKPGFTARYSHMKYWLQLVVARPATEADRESAVQAPQPEWVEARKALHPMDRLG